MESGCSKKLLDLIPQEKKWGFIENQNGISHGSSEEKKLELKLGPPGEEDEPLVSFGYFSSMKSNAKQAHNKFPPAQEDHRGGAVLTASWAKNHHHQPKPPNCSQKRTAPGPVVGWPPIRSFRKNHATTSKLASESPTSLPHKVAIERKPAAPETRGKGLFVKINMDGVPIGRKVDLKSYDSYEKLSTAVDELFRGLLAAQRDPSADGPKQEEEKVITGVLDGNGEYTLVYEDNEGDRMLVGDVPWHMFVSTVKRLRVLKSSELSVINLGSSKKGKMVQN
ncbi:hypothetical protein ERO13_A06G189800v2 [Gossypium hirsutum]|uniref:Auxin-responsive protein n=1 Tax=Gossypium hirsutum TaxID=3635 RepID=A0A1U8MG09_GOSHI|nr:auxin-responsive protein IAA26 [Gossypium hirsutum]KAG4196729.1 hypothetical protein ERO13_A06G189800v2 [Gossypium hirsutum]